MIKITKNQILDIIGIVIIVLSLLRIYILITDSTYIHIFWLCNNIPLIIGISILFRSSFFLIAETSLLLVGSLNWSLDFLSKLFFDKYLLGSTSYIFTAFSADSGISILSHLSILPLAIIAIFLIGKPEPKAWQLSLVHMIILVPASFYFGEFYNLNCLLKPCISWLPDFAIYTPLFFIIYFTIFVVPINMLFTKLLRKPKI
jgi:hypothetical protein